MKKLVVTDKGIGIAEMPEWPNSDVTDEWVRQYESAVKQAIASAPLFEDQERVKEIVGSFANTDPLMFSYEMPSGIKKPIHGTYPIPPGFPEYVEVGVCSENVCCGFGESCQNYHTILRFVDKQEQTPSKESSMNDAEVLREYAKHQTVLVIKENLNRIADRLDSLQSKLKDRDELLEEMVGYIRTTKTDTKTALTGMKILTRYSNLKAK